MKTENKNLPASDKIEEGELVDLAKEIKFEHKIKKDLPKNNTKSISKSNNCGPCKQEYSDYDGGDCDCMDDDYYDNQMTMEEYYRHYYGYGYM